MPEFARAAETAIEGLPLEEESGVALANSILNAAINPAPKPIAASRRKKRRFTFSKSCKISQEPANADILTRVTPRVLLKGE